jgi:hypothetical protein
MGVGALATSGQAGETLQDVSSMAYDEGPLMLSVGLTSWFTDQVKQLFWMSAVTGGRGKFAAGGIPPV